MSLQEFFHMGGYAPYVWPSYGLALIVLLANLVKAWTWRHRLLRELARKQRQARSER